MKKLKAPWFIRNVLHHKAPGLAEQHTHGAVKGRACLPVNVTFTSSIGHSTSRHPHQNKMPGRAQSILNNATGPGRDEEFKRSRTTGNKESPSSKDPVAHHSTAQGGVTQWSD